MLHSLTIHLHLLVHMPGCNARMERTAWTSLRRSTSHPNQEPSLAVLASVRCQAYNLLKLNSVISFPSDVRMSMLLPTAEFDVLIEKVKVLCSE